MGKHLGTAKTFRFTDDELELLDGLAKRHGSQKAAVIAGLHALSTAREITDAQLVRLLTDRLTGKRAR